jgi:hypothetical protein
MVYGDTTSMEYRFWYQRRNKKKATITPRNTYKYFFKPFIIIYFNAFAADDVLRVVSNNQGTPRG